MEISPCVVHKSLFSRFRNSLKKSFITPREATNQGRRSTYVGDATCADDELPVYYACFNFTAACDDPPPQYESSVEPVTGGLIEHTVTDITREQSDKLLEVGGLLHGSWVLRKSVSHPGSFVFVVVVNKNICHYPIELIPLRGFLVLHRGMKRLFPSLNTAVEFYSTRPDSYLGCQLGRRLDLDMQK